MMGNVVQPPNNRWTMQVNGLVTIRRGDMSTADMPRGPNGEVLIPRRAMGPEGPNIIAFSEIDEQGAGGAMTDIQGGNVFAVTGESTYTAGDFWVRGDAKLAVDGPFTESGDTFHIELTKPDSGSGLVTATGAVTLGAALDVIPLDGFSGNAFTLISNTGGSPVSGTFQNLPEGWMLAVGGTYYQITYQGGAAHDDVVLATPTTTTTLSSSENPAAVGDTLTFTASVQSSASGGGPAMTGTVTFYDGSTVLGSASIDMSGSASLQVSSLMVGDHNITAVYSGDTVYPGSTSAAFDETVNKRHMNMYLDAGGSSVAAGQTFTITAYLFGPPPPTGTVTFTLIDSQGNETTLGTFTVGSLPQVQTSTSIAAAGSYHIRADYSGDGNYFSSTTTIDLTVTPS